MSRQSDIIKKATNETGEKCISDLQIEGITLDAVTESWLRKVKLYKKYSTYVKYSSIYTHHIRQHLGNRKPEDIDTKDCIALIEKELYHQNNAGTQMSKSTVNSIRTVLMQIMEFSGCPVTIPSRAYNIHFSGNLNPHPICIFTKEEQLRLQNYLLTDINGRKLGIYVCLFTGLRLGEICALKTEHIDLSNKMISISQTVQRIKSDHPQRKTELLVTSPKTASSARIIPICDILLDVLKKHMSHDTYLVNRDKLMEPRTYQYFFHRTMKALHIRERNFHSLRHTFATNCIDSRMDMKCLSEILGHADVKTTLNKYVHPSFEQKRKQLNSFASNYSQINLSS